MLKRWFDFMLAFIALLILTPLLLVVATMIRIDSKGPALFKQVRIGKHNKPFTIYKFRSMRTDTPDIPTDQLKDPAAYVTRLGKFLRKTSIDELPQLLNILKGEMSFVGPRPALYNQYELIRRRSELGIDSLLPGLTGHAQINGRDDISDDDKIKLDYEYLKQAGFLQDVLIIVKTAYLAAVSRGVRG